MRSYLKPLLGGMLALMVALSASPALAVTTPPQAPNPETSVQEPGTDVGVTEPAEEGEEAGTVEPEDETSGTAEPGTDIPEDQEPGDSEFTAPEDAGTGQGAAPGATPTPADTLDTAEQQDPGLLTEAPLTLPVSGTIAVVAEEGPQLMSAAGPADELALDSSEMTAGGIIVATDAGPIVSLEPEQLTGDIETGDRFEGELTLHAEGQDAVETAIGESGSLSVAEAIEAVERENASTDPLAPAATVSGAVVAAPVASAAAGARAHQVDMVFFTGGKNPSDEQLKDLVKRSSSYWNTQTNGKLSSLKLNYAGKKAPKGNSKTLRCSEAGVHNMWAQAAGLFQRNPDSYLTSGRHLVVVVDDNCGTASKGVAGLGTYGKSLHSGGMVWVDVGQRGGGNVNKATGLLAHELGHNLSLGHGNTRVCSGSATDAKQGASGRPGSPCWDLEYGDLYNVMGFGSSLGGVSPPSLSISQKHMLGVAPTGSVRTVKAAGGRSQTFTLQPGGNNAGQRGLRVESPTGGIYYVEYRNMSGSDKGLGLTQNGWTLGQGTGPTFVQNHGVRVMRTHTTAHNALQNIRTSTAISVRDSVNGNAGLYQTMRSGKKSTPWNSTARVTVLSTGATAKVRVDFTPFIDVPYAHKFGKEINWMSSAKLSTGNKAGGSLRKYAPSQSVTREAMAAFLYRLESPKGYKAPKKSPFKDVKTNHKFYKQIAWMHSAGVSKGTKVSGGYVFEPSSSVTREAMAAFIYRFENSKVKAPKKSPFVDVKPGQKFYKQIAWMHSSGLSTGVKQSNGKKAYQPKGKVTREAMAAFIYRLKH